MSGNASSLKCNSTQHMSEKTCLTQSPWRVRSSSPSAIERHGTLPVRSASRTLNSSEARPNMRSAATFVRECRFLHMCVGKFIRLSGARMRTRLCWTPPGNLKSKLTVACDGIVCPGVNPVCYPLHGAHYGIDFADVCSVPYGRPPTV